MMTRSRWTLAAVLVVLASWPVRAGADPISAAFHIQVTERSVSQDGGPSVTEPFQQQFMLSMTFDPAQPTPGFEPGSYHYGAPTFSVVPLDAPSAPDDLPIGGTGNTLHGATAMGGAYARAETQTFGSRSVDGNLTVYSTWLILNSFTPAASPPLTVTPETFSAHLSLTGQNPFSPFNFFYTACLGIGPFGAGADSCNDAMGAGSRVVSYSGTALLMDADTPVIPEPATLALVGSGIVFLVRGRTRLRRKTTP